jgi:hypothetical protein
MAARRTWAAGAVIAVARVNGLSTGRATTAQQVTDELDVTLGALAVTEQQQLARAPRATPLRWLRIEAAAGRAPLRAR